MRGSTQHNWQHSIRKVSTQPVGRRVSITARYVHPLACGGAAGGDSKKDQENPCGENSNGKVAHDENLNLQPSPSTLRTYPSEGLPMPTDVLLEGDDILLIDAIVGGAEEKQLGGGRDEGRVRVERGEGQSDLRIPEVPFALKPTARWGDIEGIRLGAIVTGAYLLWCSSLHRHVMRGIAYASGKPAESVKLNEKAKIGNSIVLRSEGSDTAQGTSAGDSGSTSSDKKEWQRWQRLDYVGEGRGKDQELVRGNRALLMNQHWKWPVRVIETLQGTSRIKSCVLF